jgi:tyrosyl-DNA phosphodiesterase-1
MQTLVLTPLLNSNQERFAEEGTSVSGMACGQVLSSLDNAASERNNKRTHSAGPLKDVLPLTFRLMRVQGLPSWTNTSVVTIQDVIQVLLIKHGHFQWKLLE